MKKPNTCELFLLGVSKLYQLGTEEDLKRQKVELQIIGTASKHYS